MSLGVVAKEREMTSLSKQRTSCNVDDVSFLFHNISSARSNVGTSSSHVPGGNSSMMMEFDVDCGCVLGFQGSDGLAKVIKGYIKGMTTQYDSDPISA